MPEKEAVLVSACLLGVGCRYDGKTKENRQVLALLEKGVRLVPVCPEQLCGLPTDVTDGYRRGAEEALRLARLYRCRLAVLKARSPSCGKGGVYDGAFAGRLIPGDGVAARLLLEHGIRVFTEEEIGAAFPEEDRTE